MFEYLLNNVFFWLLNRSIYFYLKFCTTLGALIMPMAFDTVHDLTHSVEAAIIAAGYLIFGKYSITYKIINT